MFQSAADSAINNQIQFISLFRSRNRLKDDFNEELYLKHG